MVGGLQRAGHRRIRNAGTVAWRAAGYDRGAGIAHGSPLSVIATTSCCHDVPTVRHVPLAPRTGFPLGGGKGVRVRSRGSHFPDSA